MQFLPQTLNDWLALAAYFVGTVAASLTVLWRWVLSPRFEAIDERHKAHVKDISVELGVLDAAATARAQEYMDLELRLKDAEHEQVRTADLLGHMRAAMDRIEATLGEKVKDDKEMTGTLIRIEAQLNHQGDMTKAVEKICNAIAGARNT